MASLTSALRGDRHLAEEAATVTWLILLRRQPARDRPLDGWLYVTALNITAGRATLQRLAEQD